MPTVDAQVHIWAASTPERPWPARHQPEEIPWLTADDKEWIMGRGVCEWLGWKA